MTKNLYHKLTKTRRGTVLILMIICTLLCMALLKFRVVRTGYGMYHFLNWNLFLAWVPFIVSTLLWTYREKLSKWMIVAGVFVWLLFLPNAPYILTDIFHLKPKGNVPHWFDLILVLSFAWTGFILGLLSLLDIHNLLLKKTKPWLSWSFIFAFIGLCSFGIYLGRYLRFNSWDLVSKPSILISEIADRIMHPFSHPATYQITIAFTVFIFMAYIIFRIVSRGSSSLHAKI